MKLTIVIDTDDEQGVRDSYKIVNHFYRKFEPRAGYGREIRFGKIAFIKMLRKFAKAAKAAEAAGEDTGSLRWTKHYADPLFMKESI